MKVRRFLGSDVLSTNKTSEGDNDNHWQWPGSLAGKKWHCTRPDPLHTTQYTLGRAQSKKPRECDHEVCKVAADSSELRLGWLWSADGRIGDPFKETEAKIQWLPCPDENILSYILEQKWGACRWEGIEIFWVQEVEQRSSWRNILIPLSPEKWLRIAAGWWWAARCSAQNYKARNRADNLEIYTPALIWRTIRSIGHMQIIVTQYSTRPRWGQSRAEQTLPLSAATD